MYQNSDTEKLAGVQSGPAREGCGVNNIEVVGKLNTHALSKTVSAILSWKYGKEITVTMTPSGQDERTARPAKSRSKSDQRASI